MGVKKNKGSKPSTTHDINNLLASIMLSAELLLRENAEELKPSQKKYLKNIVKDSRKIQSLLKQY